MDESLATAFRYMSRFACIGERCESTCCSGWEIQVDQSHYKRLKKKMSGTRQERDLFDASLQVFRGESRSRGKYALMVIQPESGDCALLGADRLCTAQSRYGEEVLSDTCAVYPRTLSKSGDRREMAGSVSCPEVARQLLLHDDALDLVEVSGAAFARSTFQQSLPAAPADAYLRHHDALRNVASDLLADTAYPVASRLFFLAFFANRTVPYLHRGAEALDEARLAADVEQVLDPSFRRELHQHFVALHVDDTLAVNLVVHLLNQQSRRGDRFRALVESALIAYGRPEASGEVPAEALIAEYRRRSGAWTSRHAARIDRYLANYARNYWMREWYARSADLLAHTEALLVRIAVLRFVLFGHPSLAGAESLSQGEQGAVLDAAIVDVVNHFARRFEHDAAFASGLASLLASAGLRTLAHAICFARF